MPVVLEKVDNPSEQDLIDLEKLYNDYPTDFRFSNLQQLLSDNPELSLYGARFNARLLGAVTTQQTGDNIKLDHLCVRKVTRQRNVARELLRQLTATLDSSTFHFESCIDEPSIDALFAAIKFTKQDKTFTSS